MGFQCQTPGVCVTDEAERRSFDGFLGQGFLSQGGYPKLSSKICEWILMGKPTFCFGFFFYVRKPLSILGHYVTKVAIAIYIYRKLLMSLGTLPRSTRVYISGVDILPPFLKPDPQRVTVIWDYGENVNSDRCGKTGQDTVLMMLRMMLSCIDSQKVAVWLGNPSRIKRRNE